MQRNYENNSINSRITNRQHPQVLSMNTNRDASHITPNNNGVMNRRFHTRSHSNNTSYMGSNGDKSRLMPDKTVPYKEYGDYNKSNFTQITGNEPASTYGESKRERRLDYEIRYRDENIKKLEAENNDLKREIHRLRKIEAGWSMGGNRQVSKEEKLHNAYIIEENNNLKIEIEEYKAKYMELESIIESIDAEKQELERRLLNSQRDHSQEDYILKEIDRLKNNENSEIKKLNEEKLKLEKERRRMKEEEDKYQEEKDKYKDEKEKIKNDRNRYREERNVLKKRLRQLEASLDEFKRGIKEKDRAIEKLREKEIRIEDNQKYREIEDQSKRKGDEIIRLRSELEALRRNRFEKTAIENQVSELNLQINQLTQENHFLHKKLAIIEGSQRNERKLEYSDTERVQELERLLELYKNRLLSKDEQISRLKREVDILKDEIQRYKLTKEEADIKSRLGSNIEYKDEAQKFKTMKIRAEELDSRVKHLEIENQKLRDVLQQSGLNFENNRHVNTNTPKNGNFDYEIEDMGVKAVLKQLEMEKAKNENEYHINHFKKFQENINNSWKNIH